MRDFDFEPPLMMLLVGTFLLLMTINIRGCSREDLEIRAKACAEVKGYLTAANECVAKPKVYIGAQ